MRWVQAVETEMRAGGVGRMKYAALIAFAVSFIWVLRIIDKQAKEAADWVIQAIRESRRSG
jgi:hypothetical protein